MAAGVPVISTELGAEGLAVQNGIHLQIAESAPEWIRALEAISDPASAAALTASARQLVLERYDWRAIGRKLVATYEEWLSSR
jgi:glycosyltransferase involved in cell wall biosynthesis